MACWKVTMFNYLSLEPLPPHTTTIITDDNGKPIATWVSTNLRPSFEAGEVEEAVRWAALPSEKYLEMRKEKNSNA